MGLRIKLLLPLVAFSLLMGVYLRFYWMPRSMEYEEAQYQRYVERHLESVGEELIPLLLGNQLDTIHENLNALLKKNTDWAGITLRDGSGRLLFPLQPVGGSPAQGEVRAGSKVRVIKRQIGYLSMNLGTLSVDVDFGPALAGMRKVQMRLLVTLLSVLVLSVISLGLVLDRLVRKPLSTLALASARLSEGDSSVPLTNGRSDEVGMLVNSFVRMRDSMVRYQADLLREIEAHCSTEDALRASEETFRSISASAQDAIIMMDSGGSISYWNSAAERIFGYPSGEVLGKSLHELLVPEKYHESFRKGMPGFMATGHGYVIGRTLQLTALRRGGEEFPVELAISSVRLKDAWHATCILRDITERERTQQEIRTLANIVESSDEAIIGKGLDGRILTWNRGAERIYGYASDETKGLSVSILFPTDRQEELQTILEKIRTGERLEDFETVRLRKDGTPIHVSVRVSPVYSSDGTLVGASTFARDITEKKKLEEQLRQAQKMEAVGQLAGGIAHDFNNFLTAIIGYGTLLGMNIAEGSACRAYVDQILAAAERSANLTRQLLAFSRKQVMELRVVDVNDILRGVDKLLRRLIGEDIEFRSDLAGQGLLVMADRGQIEQVVMNFATNARDAMPEGGFFTLATSMVELDGSTAETRGLRPGPYALLTASDTGTGMDEKTRQRIFEPFFSTKETGKGTGLGLSIVYGIIKQHNGQISVYSEPGKGTTFRIYLPLVRAGGGESPVMPVQALQRGHETVLVAEDNDEVRRLTTHVLEEFGYTVLGAKDGEEALSLFNEHRDAVDILLLDVIMPKISGREVCDAIRQINPKTKMIFTSGYTEDILKKKGIFGEGLHFIAKPASPHDLLKKLREVLDAPEV